MTVVGVMVSFISVQSAKPSTSFGTMDYPPIKMSTKEILTRAALPTIPKGSVITSAIFRVCQKNAWSGSNALALRRNETYFRATDNWNQKPNVVSTPTDTVSASDTAAGHWWELDVTADVTAWYQKTVKYNWGWTLRTNSSTERILRGRKSPFNQPHLVITYEPPAKVPTGLSPQGGAVSIAKPVLTFNTSNNTTAIQVQIDPAADGVSPDFDSGEVASTGGELDLAGTAYAGLADGATTYWRARAKSVAGWSAWSAWVTFDREDIDPVTLTAPGATPADSTPPFAWTFGGTQTAWQADILYAGKVIRSSGFRSGADNDWTATPLTGTYFGLLLTARVRVWDDVTRIATPGVPAYSEDTTTFTPAFTASVDPMDTLVATQSGVGPGIALSGTRAAGIPDEVAVFHDGELVARLQGADVFTSGTAFAFTDWWARMGRSTVISVVAIVDGEFADDSPEVTLTPHAKGLWLVDPATGTALVLWGGEQGSTEAPDLAAEHRTVDGTIVRRRLSNTPRAGSHSGAILDVLGEDAEDTLTAFATFRGLDASTVYRLVRGRENLPVLAGNFLATPSPTENAADEVRSIGQFDWWESVAPDVVDGG